MQKAKFDLSSQESAKFIFNDGAVQLDALVQRHDFEQWISEELMQIETCVDVAAKIVQCGCPATSTWCS